MPRTECPSIRFTPSAALWPRALIAGVALIEEVASVPVISPYYLWTTPAWLAWYLYATRDTGARTGVHVQFGIAE
jgi:hypothetical protein